MPLEADDDSSSSNSSISKTFADFFLALLDLIPPLEPRPEMTVMQI